MVCRLSEEGRKLGRGMEERGRGRKRKRKREESDWSWVPEVGEYTLLFFTLLL